MNKEDVDRVLASVGYEAPEKLCRSNDNPYCTYNEAGDTPYEYKELDKYYQNRANKCIKCPSDTAAYAVDPPLGGRSQEHDTFYECAGGHRWKFVNDEHVYMKKPKTAGLVNVP